MSHQEADLTNPTEIAVIGAGILGLFNALQYAKRGFQVTLIDNIVNQKRSFKVGESLLVFTNPFLRTIGELDEFLQESFPKDGVWFTYGMENKTDFNDVTEWGFQTKLPQRWMDAMENKKLFRSLFYDAQIVRPEAEDIMRAAVYAHPNITFIDSASVKDVVIKEDNTPHEVKWEDKANARTGTVYAKWVVDCSGRNRLLARKLGHAVDLNDGFQTTAVWAQFKDVGDDLFDEATWAYRFKDGVTTRRDRNTTHLWGPGYWIWIIRLSDNRISIGATFDHKQAPAGKNYKEQFWTLINRYPILRDKLTNEKMLEFRSYKSVQYFTDTFVSEKRYGMAGDAASIIDAYYSQGISLAMVTSWHIANIVEKDLRGNHLDRKYINRVNEATRADWQMMRNTVRTKYSAAIADSRYFILSHILDITIFSAVIPPRFRLTRWLAETGGDPSREKKIHKFFRKYLEKRLFLSQTPTWSFLPPDTVQKLQSHFQEGIAARAKWRLENGVELPKIKSIVRVVAPFPALGKGLFNRKKKLVDISPKEMIEPAFIRIKGTESLPIPMAIGGPTLLSLFLAGYAYDWAETGVRKLIHQLTGRSGRVARVEAPADSGVEQADLEMISNYLKAGDKAGKEPLELPASRESEDQTRAG